MLTVTAQYEGLITSSHPLSLGCLSHRSPQLDSHFSDGVVHGLHDELDSKGDHKELGQHFARPSLMSAAWSHRAGEFGGHVEVNFRTNQRPITGRSSSYGHHCRYLTGLQETTGNTEASVADMVTAPLALLRSVSLCFAGSLTFRNRLSALCSFTG